MIFIVYNQRSYKMGDFGLIFFLRINAKDILEKFGICRTFDLRACDVSVTGVTRWTVTHWNVIVHRANSILTAHIWTWINALISNTGSVSWTLSIQNTFRMASSIWITNIIRNTGTNTFFALSICTARAWSTFVFNYWYIFYKNFIFKWEIKKKIRFKE